MNIFKRFSTPILILVVIEALLLLYFPPSFILEPTVTAGGDTASHFLSAVAMQGASSIFSPVMWVHGNYAGFPLFLHYFPLPFMLMSLLSFITSIQVAFKIVTILAIIPLPAAVYYCLRRLGFQGLVPALGAVFSLPFLIMSENHMWGGNIASTMAGEFAFGISFILTVVYMGRLFVDAPNRRSLVPNSLIEALIALGNGYPILQAGAGTSYFLLRGGSTRYILALHALAFGLIGYWILPLIRFIPWNSPYAHSWVFTSPYELFPPPLWPAMAGSLIGLAPHAWKIPHLIFKPGSSSQAEKAPNPEQYLWWQFGIALLLFGLAPHVGLVDVRFMPFAQICIVMLGAIGWGKLINRLPHPNAWISAFAVAIIIFSVAKSAMVDSWIRYNYTGMETKPLWHSFSEINHFLEGTENSPRVVYEHSEIINGAGTTRAFEMLPLFSGRSTLEGLYMQSSITAPFAFYMQSELSQTPSTPLPDYFYSRFNPARLAEHMRLFNTNQAISVSENIHNGMDDSPDFELQMTFPPFRVYLVRDAEDTNVVPLRYQPFRIPDSNWKNVQFEWFRKSSLKTPLVVVSENSPGDFWKSLSVFEGPLENLPETALAGAEDVKASALLSENRISVTTSTPGHPLWIKVSYHPSWRIAQGEGELYPASPTFMLLVPGTPDVVLEFDTGKGIYLLGRMLSLIAITVCLGIMAGSLVRKSRKAKNYRDEPKRSPDNSEEETGPSSTPGGLRFSANARLAAASALIAVAVFSATFNRSDRDPQLLYNKASAKYEMAEQISANPDSGEATPEQVAAKEKLLSESLELLERTIARFPDSYVFDHCFYLKACILANRVEMSDLRAMTADFISSHPDTRVLPECYYLIAETYLHDGNSEEALNYYYSAALTWPENGAAKQSGLRMAEIIGPDIVFQYASDLFESGNYLGAYSLFKALTAHPDEEVKERSTVFLAYCCFYLNRWEEASNLFLDWLNTNMDSPGSADAMNALSQCNILIKQNKAWQNSHDNGMPETTIGKILKLFNLAA